MTSGKLEERVAAPEAELASLKSKLEGLSPSTPWWERIAGTFENDPVYQKAIKLGREYRRSLKPNASGHKRR